MVFMILGLLFGAVLMFARNILLYAILLFLIAIYFLFLGVISLRKKWYEKYIIFSNRLNGVESDINPLVFQGIKIGAVIYLFIGFVVLVLSILLILSYLFHRSF
jgi:hypothetical protein